jgi:hypothetical protein
VDPAQMAAMAQEQDIARYRQSLAAQEQLDPATAQMRKLADAGLGATDPNETIANALLAQLYSENVNIDPRNAEFQNLLKERATEQMRLGGSLSPEQQAELVRAGLEQTGTTGVGPGSRAGKQSIGKLLVSEQEALGQNRAALAQQLFGFSEAMDQNRAGRLGGIAGQAGSQQQITANKLFGMADLADRRMPTVGLSGADMVNLAVSNVNTKNEAILGQGNIAAEGALARGQIGSSLLGGLAQVPGIYQQERLQKQMLERLFPAVRPNTAQQQYINDAFGDIDAASAALRAARNSTTSISPYSRA